MKTPNYLRGDLTTRRKFLVAAAALPALAWAHGVLAQPKKTPVIIGWLSTLLSDAGDLAIFREGMAALGRRDGIDFSIEARWGGGGSENRLQQLAVELASKKPAVIVTYNLIATEAAASTTSGIPIVQANGGSPVIAGLAASLARPGGLVTGLINRSVEIAEKFTEFLHDLIPKLQRAGYLLDATPTSNRADMIESTKRAARRFKVQTVFAEVARAEELEAAFAQFQKSGVQGIVELPSTWFATERPRIAQLALRHKLPLIGNAAAGEAGALIGYGPSRSYAFRRAAWYVDQILKSTKPGDLPIEQLSKFEVVVNLRTARELGITVPKAMLLRADRVIE